MGFHFLLGGRRVISRQLELGLDSRTRMPLRGRSRGRTNRAHWWFEKMRGVVQEAQEWAPATPSSREPPGLQPADSSRQLGPNPPATTTRTIAPGAYRWHFSRTRRLVWE